MQLWNFPTPLEATNSFGQRLEMPQGQPPLIQQTHMDVFSVSDASFQVTPGKAIPWQTTVFSSKYTAYKFDSIVQPEANWMTIKEGICAVTRYVLHRYFEDNPEKISTGEGHLAIVQDLRRLLNVWDTSEEGVVMVAQFEVSGTEILRTLAGLRHPELNQTAALEKMGVRTTIREMKKLLNVWRSSEEGIVRGTRLVLANQLGCVLLSLQRR